MLGAATLRIKQNGDYQLSTINDSIEFIKNHISVNLTSNPEGLFRYQKGAWAEPILEKIRGIKSRWTGP